MASILPTRSDADRYVRTYSLEGVTFRVAFNWRPAAGAWYADIQDSAGADVAAGQRVTPSAPLWPDGTLPTLPPGRAVVIGPDGYAKGQLGTDVQIVYLTAAEVAAL